MPNFLLIFLDDMEYGNLTFTGATGFNTPNFEKLANKGMLYTHFYTPQAVYSISRSGLLTCCYPNRIGIIRVRTSWNREECKIFIKKLF